MAEYLWLNNELGDWNIKRTRIHEFALNAFPFWGSSCLIRTLRYGLRAPFVCAHPGWEDVVLPKCCVCFYRLPTLAWSCSEGDLEYGTIKVQRYLWKYKENQSWAVAITVTRDFTQKQLQQEKRDLSIEQGSFPNMTRKSRGIPPKSSW